MNPVTVPAVTPGGNMPDKKKIMIGCSLLAILFFAVYYYFYIYKKKNEKFSSLKSNKVTVDDISDDDSDCSQC